jgi:hypothetical protein
MPLTLKLSLPSPNSSSNRRYTGKGLDPVGKPNTKCGLVGEGLNEEIWWAM